MTLSDARRDQRGDLAMLPSPFGSGRAPLDVSEGGGPARPSVGYTFHCNVVGGMMRERKRDMYISKLLPKEEDF